MLHAMRENYKADDEPCSQRLTRGSGLGLSMP